MNRTIGLVLASALGLAAGGCYVDVRPRRVVYVENDYPPPPPPQRYDDWPQPREEPGVIVVESEPPRARVEVITACPGVDFVWVGGYWAWHGAWYWRPGYWHHCPPGYGWRSGVWVSRSGRSYWRAGVWVRR